MVQRVDLRTQRPRDNDDVGWIVYQDLKARILDHPDAGANATNWLSVERRLIAEMNAGQRDVYVFNNLRREVDADGFDAYFLWHADSAPMAPAAARRFGGEPWHALVVDAMAVVGQPFPTDWDQRENRIFELQEGDDGRLNVIDERKYNLEADAPVDPAIDSYIWANPDLFFLPSRLSRWLRRGRQPQ